ncbi:hypothetical protein ACIQLK_07000 [Microbacterium sp. NPDC091382]|uniref:hypothetical protein n=1 Tax=Microbacterium sp. NPDC091382 TaxID=3364210 RepID=UPI00382F6F83
MEPEDGERVGVKTSALVWGSLWILLTALAAIFLAAVAVQEFSESIGRWSEVTASGGKDIPMPRWMRFTTHVGTAVLFTVFSSVMARLIVRELRRRRGS